MSRTWMNIKGLYWTAFMQPELDYLKIKVVSKIYILIYYIAIDRVHKMQSEYYELILDKRKL